MRMLLDSNEIIADINVSGFTLKSNISGTLGRVLAQLELDDALQLAAGIQAMADHYYVSTQHTQIEADAEWEADVIQRFEDRVDAQADATTSHWGWD